MITLARRGKSTFGSVDRLPSGRYRARFTGPDGNVYSARTEADKPLTFDTRRDADAYLAKQRGDISRGTWTPPGRAKTDAISFGAYAEIWLAQRALAVRTREGYAQQLRDHLLPTFGDKTITSITPTDVRTWHAGLNSKTPTAKAQAYGLLRTIMGTAVSDEVIAANPCRIRGAGQVRRAREIKPASLEELEAVVTALPPRYKVMALMAAWCALRFGELAELRRADVEIRQVKGVNVGTVRVSRGVIRSREQGRVVKGPKSEAGKRAVAIPPHLIPAIEDHLRDHVAKGKDALLFPSANDPAAHLAHSALNKVWLNARAKAGRPDLAFHDLRHTGAVLAAQTGATLAELMARLGHSTPAAAMRYQHAAADRDRLIADALSALASAPRHD